MLASFKIPSSLHKSSIDHLLFMRNASGSGPFITYIPSGPNSIELDKAEPATIASEIGLNEGVMVSGLIPGL